MTRTRGPAVAARALAALTLCLLLGAVTGCSSGAPQLLPRPSSTYCARSDHTLRIATGSDLSASGVRGALIERWSAEHHYKVQTVELPADADGQRSQLVAALQSGNPDCYDLVNLDVTWTAEFAAQGLVAPLPQRLSGLLPGFWPAARDSVRYAGKDWAVPWNTDVGLLYYRADLLDAKPDLSTWPKLRAAVQRFDRQRDPQVDSGLLTQLDSYEGLTVNANEAVWRNGGTIVRGEGERAEVTVDDSKAVAGLGALAEALGPEDPEAAELPVIGQESLGLDELSSVEHFLSGDSLMLRDWPFAASRLAEAGTKGADEDSGRPVYGVTTLPGLADGSQGAAALGGQNLALVAGSPDSAAAEDLVATLSGAGAQRCLRAGGFVPALRAAADGDCRASLVAGNAPHFTPLPEPLRTQYRVALDKALGQARTRPVTPYYASVTRDIQERVHELLATGETDYEAFASELRAALRGH